MKAEVIIVGGGAIGTAAAYFLARRGVDVLLLERSHLAAGASGVTAAMLGCGAGYPEPLMPFAQEGARLVRQLQDDSPVDLELVSGGSLTVAFDDDELDELRPVVDADREMGIDTRVLAGREARDLEPLLAPEVRGVVHRPLNYHVNPYRLCQAYVQGARERGARIRYGTTVRDVRVDGGRIAAVETDEGDCEAEWVVVAGGACSAQVLRRASVPLEVAPARGQAIITEAVPLLTRHMISGPGHVYTRQVARGNFYVGSHTEYVGFDKSITLEKVSAYVRAAAAMVPMLAQLRALRFFCGFRPMTPDNLPLLGPMPDCPRLLIATGHGRTGMLYSAPTGKAISEMIVGGRAELPVEAFRVERFAEGDAGGET